MSNKYLLKRQFASSIEIDFIFFLNIYSCKTKPTPDFLFNHFLKVYRANIEKVLSVRGDFNPFNEVAVIAFSVLFKSAMC